MKRMSCIFLLLMVACTPGIYPTQSAEGTPTLLKREAIKWHDAIWVDQIDLNEYDDASLNILASVFETVVAINQETIAASLPITGNGDSKENTPQSILDITKNYWKVACQFDTSINNSYVDAYGFNAYRKISKEDHPLDGLDCLNPLSQIIKIEQIRSEDHFLWTNYELRIRVNNKTFEKVKRISITLPGSVGTSKPVITSDTPFNYEVVSKDTVQLNSLVFSSNTGTSSNASDPISLSVTSTKVNAGEIVALILGTGVAGFLGNALLSLLKKHLDSGSAKSQPGS